MLTRPFVVLLLAALIGSGAVSMLLSPLYPVGVAFADDDDDGGDDDDDNGASSGGFGGGGGRSANDDDDDDAGRTGASSGGSNRSGGGLGRATRNDNDDDGPRVRSRPQSSSTQARPQRQVQQRPAAPPPPPPEFAPREIVALSLSDTDLAALIDQGFSVIEEAPVPGIAAIPRRLATPGNITLAAARDLVRSLPSGQDADFNHFYRTEDGFDPTCRGAECPARLMIDWPLPDSRDGPCGRGVPIGMIDTGINETHATFDGASIEVLRLSPESFDASRALHGTAVAALLVGAPGTRSPGLLPAAEIVAIDAFYRQGQDERADVFTLVRSLGALSEAGVQVINLSLAGPENAVLEEVITRLVRVEDIVIVAAVGNSGPRADPEYPAAYDLVIAVTAVDRDGNVYRRAVQGPHVDIAAPGVNIWTAASISGARWKTGTSYAVPFVTAAAALLREAQPELTATEVGTVLGQRARDLGEPGHDPVFGAGLLDISGLCPVPD